MNWKHDYFIGDSSSCQIAHMQFSLQKETFACCQASGHVFAVLVSFDSLMKIKQHGPQDLSASPQQNFPPTEQKKNKCYLSTVAIHLATVVSLSSTMVNLFHYVAVCVRLSVVFVCESVRTCMLSEV